MAHLTITTALTSPLEGLDDHEATAIITRDSAGMYHETVQYLPLEGALSEKDLNAMVDSEVRAGILTDTDSHRRHRSRRLLVL